MEGNVKIKLSSWGGITAGLILLIAFIVALIKSKPPTDGIQGFSAEMEAEEISDEAVIEAQDELETEAKEPTFILPVKGRVLSKFGYRQHPLGGGRDFHKGIDIAAPWGSPIKAAADGKVVFADRRNGGGNTVILRHSAGYKTYYLHLSKIEVKRGEQVKQGKIIGLVGSSGLATGPHLHFEIRKNGISRDPLKYLPSPDSW